MSSLPPASTSLSPPTLPTGALATGEGRPFGVQLATTAIWLAQYPAARRFMRAADSVASCQEQKLLSLLKANAKAAYGRHHGFGDLRTVKDFQDRVPVVTYDDLAPWVERILKGEQGVLTAEPVLMLEMSSGTAAASKYVPFTRSLRSEFSAATGAWLSDLYGHQSELRAGRSYWSVSPVGSLNRRTPGGLPIGFEDDTEYFGATERLLLGKVLAAPSQLARVCDPAAWRYLTLYFLLAAEDLRFISIWNPSFLTVLLGALPALADELLFDLERGKLTPPGPVEAPIMEALRRRAVPQPERAAMLREVLRGSKSWTASALWPDLRAISCWTDATAEHFLPELRALFPGVPLQGKGLLSTEGAVSFPLHDQPAPALAVTSHFYEFQPLDRPEERPLLAHQLDRGGRYRILLTTGGGFTRYATGDAIEVVGHWKQVPLLRFLGKADMVSDLCGEKLSSLFVDQALGEARREFELEGKFLLVAPELGDPPFYQVLANVSSRQASGLAEFLERRFQDNHHYAYARRIGQLGPMKGLSVPDDATERYLAACQELGQRVGNVKPVCLQRTFGWPARLGALAERGQESKVEPHGR